MGGTYGRTAAIVGRVRAFQERLTLDYGVGFPGGLQIEECIVQNSLQRESVGPAPDLFYNV